MVVQRFCSLDRHSASKRAHARQILSIVEEVASLKERTVDEKKLTSRAETNCRGLSALFMSGMLDSKS